MVLLPEGAELTLAELREMAARQQQQIEAQQQLLVAKEQRLKFLKQQEARHHQGAQATESERLRHLRERVEAQELKLRRLRALRGQVDQQKTSNTNLGSELETIRALFNEKEKELSVAVAKVDELTQQLEEIRRGNLNGLRSTGGSSSSPALIELEKLRRELLYRTKLNEQQNARIALQKETLAQRQEEMSHMDHRIAELQQRLHRKRVLNQQLANQIHAAALAKQIQGQFRQQPHQGLAEGTNGGGGGLKAPRLLRPLGTNVAAVEPLKRTNPQQENERSLDDLHAQLGALKKKSQEDQLSEFGANKGDLKYQTLPYNTKFSLKLAPGEGNSHPEDVSKTTIPPLPSSVPTDSEVQKNDEKSDSSSYVAPPSLPPPPSVPPPPPPPPQQVRSVAKPIPRACIPGYGHLASSHLPVPTTRVPPGSGSNNNSMSVPVPPVTVMHVTTSSIPTRPVLSTTGGSGIPRAKLPPTPLVPGRGPNDHRPTGPQPHASVPAIPKSEGAHHLQVVRGIPQQLVPPTTSALLSPRLNSQRLRPSQESTTADAEGGQSACRPILPPKPALPVKPVPPPRQTHSQGGSGPEQGYTETTPEAVDTALSVLKGAGNQSCRSGLPYRFPVKPPPVGLQRHSQSSGEPFAKTLTQTHSDRSPEPTSDGGAKSAAESRAATDHQNGSRATSILRPKPLSGSRKVPPGPEGVRSNVSVVGSQQRPPDSVHVGIHRRIEMPPAYFFPETQKLPSPADLPSSKGASEDTVAVRGDTTDRGVANTEASLPRRAEKVKWCPATPEETGDPQQFLDQFNGNSSVAEADASPLSLVSDTQLNGIRTEADGDATSPSQENSDCLPERSSPQEETEDDRVTTAHPHHSAALRRVKKGNLKTQGSARNPRRVSFDPLALLLDAALEGELELVKKTACEVPNPSASNDEGITALHNAICAGHFEIVRFLVEYGCDVNAQDSDGWTPLHCAASCNNLPMVRFLVEHGACIFATTLSDHETAAEKCEEDEEGFDGCSEYLYSIQEKLGILNGGAVYAVYEYEAQNADELSFKDGDMLVVLRKGDDLEREWWWSRLGDHEGYIPRNLLGLCPRVMARKDT